MGGKRRGGWECRAIRGRAGCGGHCGALGVKEEPWERGGLSQAGRSMIRNGGIPLCCLSFDLILL